MSKFSKFGASALALALSFALVSPVTANAYVDTTYEDVDDDDSYYVTYTNTDTKESISQKDYDFNINYNFDWVNRIEDGIASSEKQHVISTKDYSETLSFTTGADVAKFSNFKSNKKALKVKVTYKKEQTWTKDYQDRDYDYSSKDGKNYYYWDVNGKLQTVDSKDKLPLNSAEGTYTIRLYAKKAGTYKLTYDATLEDGSTVKKTVKIVAKEDGNAIKQVTFGGKVVFRSDAQVNADYGDAQKGGIYYVTKGKGKLKVTTNSGYKIKKIEVGTPNIETINETYDESDATDVTHKIVDKSRRDYYTWKTVKNGKKITLSSVDESAVDVGNVSFKRYTDEEKKDLRREYTVETKGTTARTPIRITYYDKKNKITKQFNFSIDRLINK